VEACLETDPKIGNATAARVWERLAYVPEPLAMVRAEDFATVLPKGAQGGWREFVELVKTMLEPDALNNPAKQIELVLARGYLDYLQASYENAEAREKTCGSWPISRRASTRPRRF
jgi:hypothetical protein